MIDFFFFFKQKTAYEMRISDWSSDVCSSDLFVKRSQLQRLGQGVMQQLVHAVATTSFHALFDRQHGDLLPVAVLQPQQLGHREIGRASCRERVCQYV